MDGAITFFEDNDDRRAYCKAYIGEKLNEQVVLSNNETIRFDSVEEQAFDQPLLPEQCDSPVYEKTVVAPVGDAFGYTEYTCIICGYTYRDDYFHQ